MILGVGISSPAHQTTNSTCLVARALVCVYLSFQTHSYLKWGTFFHFLSLVKANQPLSQLPCLKTMYHLLTCHSQLIYLSTVSLASSYTTPTSSMAGNLTAQKKNTTFLTVSDLPMELSKQLQAVVQMNQGVPDVLRRSLPNIDQYQYDFSLERAVLRSFERHT